MSEMLAAADAVSSQMSCNPVSLSRRAGGILLARATVTSMRGLRASICSSHDPFGAPRLLACRTTALLPMISNRRSVRSPIFEIEPSFCLPPAECWRGVRPTHTAKSRPLANVPDGRRRTA